MSKSNKNLSRNDEFFLMDPSTFDKYLQLTSPPSSSRTPPFRLTPERKRTMQHDNISNEFGEESYQTPVSKREALTLSPPPPPQKPRISIGVDSIRVTTTRRNLTDDSRSSITVSPTLLPEDYDIDPQVSLIKFDRAACENLAIPSIISGVGETRNNEFRLRPRYRSVTFHPTVVSFADEQDQDSADESKSDVNEDFEVSKPSSPTSSLNLGNLPPIPFRRGPLSRRNSNTARTA